MRCLLLQCFALRIISIPWFAPHCITLHCCNLNYTALRCTSSYCVVLHFSKLKCAAFCQPTRLPWYDESWGWATCTSSLCCYKKLLALVTPLMVECWEEELPCASWGLVPAQSLNSSSSGPSMWASSPYSLLSCRAAISRNSPSIPGDRASAQLPAMRLLCSVVALWRGVTSYAHISCSYAACVCS